MWRKNVLILDISRTTRQADINVFNLWHCIAAKIINQRDDKGFIVSSKKHVSLWLMYGPDLYRTIFLVPIFRPVWFLFLVWSYCKFYFPFQFSLSSFIAWRFRCIFLRFIFHLFCFGVVPFVISLLVLTWTFNAKN